MASIVRENRPKKPWRVQWVEDGRKRTMRFATRREAEAFVGDIARGKRVTTEAPRLVEWVPRWIMEDGPTWESRTRHDRGADLDKWVLPYLGNRRLRDISRSDVKAWRSRVMADGATAYRAQRAMTILSACLSAAVEADLIPANPCAGVKAVAWKKNTREPVPLATVEALRLTLARERDRALVSVLAYAGLRPGEAVALEWDDVREATIVVRRGLRDSGKTKTGSLRTIPIIPAVREDLDALERGSGSVFGIVNWRNWAGRVLRPARQEAGMTGDAYALRHTAASLWIAEGKSVIEVSRLLGHSTPRLTMDTYGHLFEEAQLRPAESAADAATRARRSAHASRRSRVRTA